MHIKAVGKSAPSAKAQQAQTQHTAVWKIIKIQFFEFNSPFTVAQGWLNLVALQATPLSLSANGGTYLAVENLPAQQVGSACTPAASRPAPWELEPIRTGYSLSAPMTDRRCG